MRPRSSSRFDTSTSKRVLAPVIGLLLVAALTACPSVTYPEVFLEENAWQGEVPADAQVVSPEEFRRLVGTGEVDLTSTILVEEAAAEREADFDADKQSLLEVTNPSPALTDLLSELLSVEDYAGDVGVELPGGDLAVVEGPGTSAANAVFIENLANSVDNALLAYQQTYRLLPAEIKAAAATPESLAGATLDEVLQALADIDAALAGNPAIETSRYEPQAVGPYDSAAQVASGNGNDEDAVCAAPTGLAAQYWFPLKYFVAPVKNQGGRGTCWAFTAIGALESRERVQNANPVNLSEQFLVNKVKQDWDESDYTDGYFADRAANLAVDEGQVLPDESGWTYNPSLLRPGIPDGDEDAYVDSCDPYGFGPNGGTCSDTSHQSRRVCSTFIFTVCGYATVNFAGPGIVSSRAYQVWANGQHFDLNRYRLLLSNGYVLMASFPVYKGFMDDVGADGVVSNYAKTMLDADGNEVAGSYGGHAVQIVGFLSNQEMSKPGRTPVNIGGGGYFIVKNSWGCRAGDGGYYYVPADYVSGMFKSLSALDFDGRRSAAWNAEQAAPGGSEAPSIKIKTNPARVDLRVETDLAAFFTITHPVAKGVTLKVSNPTLGTIYQGGWSTDPDALFGSSLRHTFQKVGDYYLSLEATYGTAVTTATLLARVVNSPPSLAIEASGQPYQGEPFSLAANVSDKNQPGVDALCATVSWSASAPDVLSSSSGCQVEVNFGTSGSRTVTATVRDADGLTTTRSLTLDVLPPRENPYPIIAESGVYSINSRLINNRFSCHDVAVASGATIDLRETGCSIIIGSEPHRYFAGVTVENPDNEPLTFDWQLVVTFANSGTERVLISSSAGTEAEWALYNTGNAALATDPCRVEVVVHAPDDSRDKSKTVWTGACTYYATRIN